MGNLEMDEKIAVQDCKLAKVNDERQTALRALLTTSFKSINELRIKVNNWVQQSKDTLTDIRKHQLTITDAKSTKIPEKPTKDKVKKLKKDIKPHKKAITKLTKDIELLQWLIKDPLSNAGLKNFIFNSMLGSINDILFSYSHILGFEIEFGIHIESARKDFYSLISKGDNIIEFEDLSGGQQQLVNIAIAFAIHELVNSTHSVNVLSLDEVFESLDEDNIEIATELIQQKAVNKSIYLITHNKSFTPPNASEIHLKLSESGETLLV